MTTTSFHMGPHTPADYLPVNRANNRPAGRRVALRIRGMTCASCVGTVSKKVESLPGVRDVALNLLAASCVVECDISTPSASDIVEAVEAVGFEAFVQMDVPIMPGKWDEISWHELELAIVENDAPPASRIAAAQPSSGSMGGTSLTDTGFADVAERMQMYLEKRVVGVLSCSVSMNQTKVRVRYDPQKIGARQILQDTSGRFPVLPASVFHVSDRNQGAMDLLQNLAMTAEIDQLNDVSGLQLNCAERKKQIEEDVYPEDAAGVLEAAMFERMFRRSIFPTGICLFLMFTMSSNFLRAPLIVPGVSTRSVISMICSGFVLFYCGKFYLDHAMKAIRHGGLDMNFLIAASTFVAFTYSTLVVCLLSMQTVTTESPMRWFSRTIMDPPLAFDTAAILISVALLGKVLENHAKRKTTAAIDGLHSRMEDTVSLKVDDTTTVTIPADLLQIDDVVEIVPGEKINGDGILLSEMALVDESLLTGESRPVGKQRDDVLIGGSLLSGSGVAEMCITALGSSSVLGKIHAMVTSTTSSNEDSNKHVRNLRSVADDIASKFVPVVAFVAVVTTGIWIFLVFIVGIPVPATFDLASNSRITQFLSSLMFAMRFGIAVLAVACPCSFGLATPTAVAVALGVAARQAGVLVKGGDSLEMAAKVDTVVLDKTGTVTEGHPRVVDTAMIDPLLISHRLPEGLKKRFRTIGPGDISHPQTFESLGDLTGNRAPFESSLASTCINLTGTVVLPCGNSGSYGTTQWIETLEHPYEIETAPNSALSTSSIILAESMGTGYAQPKECLKNQSIPEVEENDLLASLQPDINTSGYNDNPVEQPQESGLHVREVKQIQTNILVDTGLTETTLAASEPMKRLQFDFQSTVEMAENFNPAEKIRVYSGLDLEVSPTDNDKEKIAEEVRIAIKQLTTDNPVEHEVLANTTTTSMLDSREAHEEDHSTTQHTLTVSGESDRDEQSGFKVTGAKARKKRKKKRKASAQVDLGTVSGNEKQPTNNVTEKDEPTEPNVPPQKNKGNRGRMRGRGDTAPSRRRTMEDDASAPDTQMRPTPKRKLQAASKHATAPPPSVEGEANSPSRHVAPIILSKPEFEKLFWWMVGTVEQKSNHPIASALTSHAEAFAGPAYPLGMVEGFEQFTSTGVSGTIEEIRVKVLSLRAALSAGSKTGDISPCVCLDCACEWKSNSMCRCTRGMKKGALGIADLSNWAISMQESSCTVVIVAIGLTFVGAVALTDGLKEDSQWAIGQLRKHLKLGIWMCTGDSEKTASTTADRAGIDSKNVIAQALPHDKVNLIHRLRKDNKVVCMVGDGINDSLALAAADLGIAIGSGPEVALRAAHGVLTRNSLADLLFLIELGKATKRVIQFNFAWAIMFNTIGIVLAAGVFYPHLTIPPAVAGVLMATSSLVVVLNSLTLRKFKVSEHTSEDADPRMFATHHRNAWSQDPIGGAQSEPLLAMDV